MTVKHLTTLKGSLSWGKRDIKDQIQNADDHIKANPETPNYSIIVEPFLNIYANNNDVWRLISTKCFADIFKHASNQSFPDRGCIAKILALFYQSDKLTSEAVKLSWCNVIQEAMRSVAGDMYIHGTEIYDIMSFLVKSFDVANSQNVEKEIETTFDVITGVLLERYQCQLPVPSVPNMVQIVAEQLVRNSLEIVTFAPNSCKSTIRDVDLIAVIKVLCKAITVDTTKDDGMSIWCETLYKILASDLSFTSTPDFITLIRTDVHVSLLSLILNTGAKLQAPTARLISLCWSRFAHVYLEGLNDLLSHGLIPALSSPFPEASIQALGMFGRIVKENPQFLVDAFVNYDCDGSGHFRNIFEQTSTLIVKNAYPGQNSWLQQKAALIAIVWILKSLWDYFNTARSKITEDEPQEAQSVLDAKKAKNALDHSLQLFKQSAKKGLAFFIEQKMVEDTPEAIADFFFNNSALDPASVGEILGGPDPRNVQTLKCFVNHFDFKGLAFEQAFRQFLSKFQIPGEAQMIDRVMEQFGAKFYSDNPNLFSCADTVYVLAFSTLMLHTDAHHPNVTKRMTLDEFISNNRGIDQGKDIPTEFLEALYNGITSQKIFTSNNVMPSSSLLTREQQIDLYQQQCKETLAMARTKLTNDTNQRKFHTANSPDLIGPMFNLIWRGILAALTMSFEDSNDSDITKLCIQGMQYSMHIASHCFVEDALDTMVDSFAKFTRLRIQTKDLKQKNYDCTSALIKCAIQDRNHLKGAWKIVLGEISALDKIRDNPHTADDLINAEKLYVSTGSLDRESIIDFINAMVDISRMEIQEDRPRLFTLLKFLDVAFWNMDRPMFIWKDIWSIIGNFLTYQGKSSNESVAEASLDIIRQLSLKFLLKEEINEFHFQLHFLQPFIDIYDGQSSLKIKKLVLFSITQIITELAGVLHSGWDAIFQITTFTALDDYSLKQQGFKIVDIIIANHISYAGPFKVHMMSSLSAFASGIDDVAMSCAAVVRYSLIADCITLGETETWQCLLMTIGKCCQHPCSDVTACANEVLLSILMDHGCVNHDFSDEIWNYFFENTAAKLFAPNKRNTDEEYMREKIELFKMLYDQMILVYPDAFKKFFVGIFRNISICMKSENREFAGIAISYLLKFMKVVHANADIMNNIDEILSCLEEFVEKRGSDDTVREVVEFLIRACQDGKGIVDKILSSSKRLDMKIDPNSTVVVCATRRNRFRNMRSAMADECSVFIKDSIKKFVEADVESDEEDWNTFAVFLLTEVMKMSDEEFIQCFASLAGMIKRIVMCDSPEVRNAVGLVISRKLEIDGTNVM